MQAPGSPDEDRDGEFEHGGWMDDYQDERMEVVNDQISEADALLLGRKTYEIFASYWPHFEPADDPLATELNSMPKYVASRTLDAVEWHNSTLLAGAAEAVEDLKNDRGGVMLVQGSANLIQTLLAHDLVDEFRLWIFPLVLGDGKRLFGDGTIPEALELTDVETSNTGVQILRYERAGEFESSSAAR
ncbi:deaminase (plasmid) [Salinigranum rubrum]|uniref:Deaminase n=1 Tax=Salinigranum rubrum TaxID=755307 RepID=A0A2I8VQQ5_9EURY|nr:dihydrofolate reductase family protein [Salinigranum rubrum]AUV84248.1 deaminase [Salinigranum rubrum]